MRVREARELGKRVAGLVQSGQVAQAYASLAPVLAARTPFPMLGRIGEAIGAGPLGPANTFLEHVAAAKTEGGWVVIGSALGQHLTRDLEGAFARCREFIIVADVWYAADVLGERVPGPALVADFQPSLDLLAPWREDGNRWVRRTVGISAHLWAKRSGGTAERTAQAEALLALMAPMFEEWDMDAAKGVGWGLKTLGKYYPDLVADWLAQQVIPAQRRYRTLMLRKALTYLSDEQRARATGGSL
jgi:hypothetical protein